MPEHDAARKKTPAYPGPRWHAPAAKGEAYGDRLGAIAEAKHAGRKYIDQNSWYVLDFLDTGSLNGTAYVFHSATPAENGYRYLALDEHHTRPMTHDELHGPVNVMWDTRGVDMWREGPSVHSRKPLSYHEHAAEAVKQHITLVLELKNPTFAHHQVAQQLHHSALAVGHRPVFMALYELPHCKEKCAAFIEAGSEFAVIYGNDPGHHKRDAARIHIAKTWAVKPTWD